jgi:hypothetical protein
VRRFFIAVGCAVAAYLVCAFGGGFLIYALSSNQFDRAMEAEMTGAFVTGPLGAVVAFIAGIVFGPKQPPAA